MRFLLFFLLLMITNVSLSQCEEGRHVLEGTDVLAGVQTIAAFVDPMQNSDEMAYHLDYLFKWLGTNFELTFFYSATNFECKDDHRHWLLVDPNINSSILVNAQSFSFGSCKWLFARSQANVDALLRMKPDYISRIFLTREHVDARQSTIRITEIFTPSPASAPVELLVAVIRGQEVTFAAESIWNRRVDLDGVKIRFTMVQAPPGLFVPEGDPNKSYGFQIDIVEELRNRLNFSIENLVPTVGTFGTVDEDGQWNGMVRQLIDNEADVALILQITKQRYDVVDFSHSNFLSGQVLVTRQPDLAHSIDFLALFEMAVWIALPVFLVLFLLGSMLIAFTFSDKQSWRGRAPDWTGALVTIFGYMVAQGSEEQMNKISMRILSLTVLFFGFLSINFLCANLTSSISVRKDVEQIKSLQDVVNNNMEFFIVGGSHIEQSFSRTANTVQQKLWVEQLRDREDRRPLNYEEAMKNFLRSDNSVFMSYRDFVAMWIVQNRRVGCTLRQRRLDQGDLPISFGLRKNFPYFHTINNQLAKMRETGLIDHLHQKWVRRPELRLDYVCSDRDSDSPEISVGLGAIRLFYYILATGVAAGCIIAGVEYLYRNKTKRKKALQDSSVFKSSA